MLDKKVLGDRIMSEVSREEHKIMLLRLLMQEGGEYLVREALIHNKLKRPQSASDEEFKKALNAFFQ